jgi:hypothetical protein
MFSEAPRQDKTTQITHIPQGGINMMEFYHRQNSSKLGWWLKIEAATPICIYYFGPFSSQKEAESSKLEYFTDLAQENVKILHSETRFCQPRQLTIFEEELKIGDLEDSSALFFMNLIHHHGAPSFR